LQLHAVLFDGGTASDLNPLLGAVISNAYATNNRRDVAGGFSGGVGAATHAYRYRAESGTVTDLGTLGGALSQAYAINVFGAVTGYAHVPSQDAHAFRYDEARLRDLGTLGGATARALAINAADTIVGESTTAEGDLRAFAHAAGAMIDLNDVTSGLNGATLTTATAINDAGQIVAMSCTAPLVCPQAFRLDPVPAAKLAAIEYHHAGFDHYFMTAIADEIAKLDNGTFAGWTRTGGTFDVYAGDQVGTSPVCRFFSTAFSPKSSHFYTPGAAECAPCNPSWQFEARVFRIPTAAVPPERSPSIASTTMAWVPRRTIATRRV
jgi:probable HAF family extracellular repeat protein